MNKSKKIFCVITFIAVCVAYFTLKSQNSLSSIDNLMIQNIMALSGEEDAKYFIVMWDEEIGMKETETKIIYYMVTHTTCPSGGKEQCVTDKFYWEKEIKKNI